MLYNWDFTNSLIDTVQNQPFESSQGANLTRDSEGLKLGSERLEMSDRCNLPVDVDLTKPGYRVEFDFVSVDLLEYHDDKQAIMGTDEMGRSFGLLYYDGESPLNFTNDYDDVLITNSPDGFFDNSTFKIVTESTQNDNTIWKMYKGDTLVATTPEFNLSNPETTFFPHLDADEENPVIWSIGYYVESMIVTGIRVYKIHETPVTPPPTPGEGSIQISPYNDITTYNVGNEIPLAYAISPDSARMTLTVDSSDTSVVLVQGEADGESEMTYTITAVGIGTATITASITVSGTVYSDSVEITVTE